MNKGCCCNIVIYSGVKSHAVATVCLPTPCANKAAACLCSSVSFFSCHGPCGLASTISSVELMLPFHKHLLGARQRNLLLCAEHLSELLGHVCHHAIMQVGAANVNSSRP